MILNPWSLRCYVNSKTFARTSVGLHATSVAENEAGA